MVTKTRLSSCCTKRGDNTVNLVTPRKKHARLARPIMNYDTCLVPSKCLHLFHDMFIDILNMPFIDAECRNTS